MPNWQFENSSHTATCQNDKCHSGLHDSNRIGKLFAAARKLYATPREAITYTRDNFGLRGTHTSVQDIDILVIGGSTTDQRYIDDDATWDAVMQRELRKKGYDVTVANAAIDGQSTIGHIHSLESWLSAIPGLRPSYILFYIGINDSYYLREPRELHAADTTASRDLLPSLLFEKSFFYRLVARPSLLERQSKYRVDRPATAQDEKITAVSISDDFGRPFSLRSPDAKPGNVPYLDEYNKNLLALDHLSRLMGAKAIFASSPAGTCRFEAGAVLQQEETSFDCVSLARINRATHKVSGSNYIPFFDAASELILARPAEMYDYVHHNERGAQRIGEYFADMLSRSVNLSKFRSPGA